MIFFYDIQFKSKNKPPIIKFISSIRKIQRISKYLLSHYPPNINIGYQKNPPISGTLIPLDLVLPTTYVACVAGPIV